MSFLKDLLEKKCKLKSTKTCVTYMNGKQFLESKGSYSQVESNSCGFVIDTKPDDIPAKVVNFIYLGSQDCCEDTTLKKFNITNVLSVGIESPCKYPNVHYNYIECLDLPETNLVEVIDKCLLVIDSAVLLKQNILIHCNAGVSRSPSVIIGYLMLTHGYAYIEAFNIVHNARSCIKPNIGFEKQLKLIRNNQFN